MEMRVNSERVKTLRLAKGWSQEQLAEISSLGVRTVQRVEKDGVCSLETRNSLASALEIQSEDLQASEVDIERLATALRILNFGKYFLVACFCLGLLNAGVNFIAGDLPLNRFTGSISVLFAISGAVYTICYAIGEKLRFEMSGGTGV